MNPTYTIDDAQWQALIRQVADHFDDLTIKRGFQDYKQERVRELTLPRAGQVEALVEGNELTRCRVRVKLDAVTESECACPAGGGCKHVVAVLLAYANMQGRLVHQLVNAKSAAAMEAARVKAEAAAAGKASRASQLRGRAAGLAEQPIANWRELFAACIAPLAEQVRNAQYASGALAAIYETLPPLSPVMEQLAGLHAELFVLEQVTKPAQPTGGTWSGGGLFLGFHTHAAAAELQEAALKRLAEGIPSPSASERDYLRNSLVYLRDGMLTEPHAYPYITELYMAYWRYWMLPHIADPDALTDELTALDTAEERLGSAVTRIHGLLARGRMRFWLGDDAGAIDLLRMAAAKTRVKPDSLFAFLDELSAQGQPERRLDWLCATGPLLIGNRQDSLEQYSRYWDDMLQLAPEAEFRMWETFEEMLPFASSLYENKLMERGRYRQWMDTQLSAGVEPLDLRVSELAPIEKHEPQLLLPFYHQAVERHVLAKNRHGYKAAVKLLKRLAKLYKKLKQDERWEGYIEAFAERNGRLRALQEELRKGKLIP
ncbi:SWIM zinc finger domain-containing protein [Paenibacillus aurantiacus]|uniref:SWIM zinc finger domain-containing protein n=1 Tax=Paenibacillus aurantiacus TaxID=1936118 RepID=A0ABV5KIN9_9BACL